MEQSTIVHWQCYSVMRKNSSKSYATDLETADNNTREHTRKYFGEAAHYSTESIPATLPKLEETLRAVY